MEDIMAMEIAMEVDIAMEVEIAMEVDMLGMLSLRKQPTNNQIAPNKFTIQIVQTDLSSDISTMLLNLIF